MLLYDTYKKESIVTNRGLKSILSNLYKKYSRTVNMRNK